MTTLLAITVLASLAVACATLLVDLRRLRRAAPQRGPLWRLLGLAQVATGLLWLLYGDLALRDGASRGWLAVAIGALFVLQGVRRAR